MEPCRICEFGATWVGSKAALELIILQNEDSTSETSQHFVVFLTGDRHCWELRKAEQSRKRSLFTLFLFNPLVAFCYVCSIAVLRSDLWESCQWQVRQILNDCLRVFYDWSRCVDLVFLQLLDDEFLRLMILRFIFCFYTMHLHRAFKGSDYYPKSYPKLPAEILLNGGIEKQVLELASMLDVRSLFYEIGEGPPTD